MGANGDAKVQRKQTEQAENIVDYAAELEKYYELAKKQNGYLSAEDRAKAQRLELARNLKIYSSGLDYEQTMILGHRCLQMIFHKITVILKTSVKRMVD